MLVESHNTPTINIHIYYHAPTQHSEDRQTVILQELFAGKVGGWDACFPLAWFSSSQLLLHVMRERSDYIYWTQYLQIIITYKCQEYSRKAKPLRCSSKRKSTPSLAPTNGRSERTTFSTRYSYACAARSIHQLLPGTLTTRNMTMTPKNAGYRSSRPLTIYAIGYLKDQPRMTRRSPFKTSLPSTKRPATRKAQIVPSPPSALNGAQGHPRPSEKSMTTSLTAKSTECREISFPSRT